MVIVTVIVVVVVKAQQLSFDYDIGNDSGKGL
jgi:hypothetical protein